MQTEKLRSIVLMGALLFQSFLFNAVPQTVRAEEGVNIEPPELPPAEQTVEPRLVITAIQITGGPGHTQEDFIELYNPTSEPFDLNGYRLVKRTAAGVTDTTIQAWADPVVVLPYHFFLWANSNYTGIASQPDTTSSATLADNNGVALRQGANDSGEIVESVAWGSTTNIFESVSAVNPATNESLAREQLFEENSAFTIQTSNPRNSAVELLPELEDPEEEDEEENTDDEDDDTGDEQDEDEEVVEVSIKITELLPNPAGSDSGFEQVEVYNAGSELVNLAGFRLDDVAVTDPLSSNAYTLLDIELAVDSYAAIAIPSGKFAMNNTSGDVVSLFSPQGQSVDSVSYFETTPDTKTYSYFSSVDEWHWTDSTLGEENGEPPVEDTEEFEDEDEDSDEEVEDLGDYDNSGLEISEIYPDPAGTAEEFVEIYNAGEEPAQLSKVALVIGEKQKALPLFELAPGKYYVIPESALPAQLRNSGQIVKLMEDSSVLSTVTYPAAKDGASFARFEDGFFWTTLATEGKANILQIPESDKKVVAKVTKATVPKKSDTKAPATKAKTLSAAKKTSGAAESKQPTNVVSKADIGLAKDQAAAVENPAQDSAIKPKDSVGKIVAMGAAAVAAGVFALYKLVFAAGVE